MYNHYYNDLEGSNGQSTNNNNNEVTYRTARNFLALKNKRPKRLRKSRGAVDP